MYGVNVGNRMVVRHIDQLRKSYKPSQCGNNPYQDNDDWGNAANITTPDNTTKSNTAERRYPARIRTPVIRYGFDQ